MDNEKQDMPEKQKKNFVESGVDPQLLQNLDMMLDMDLFENEEKLSFLDEEYKDDELDKEEGESK